MNKEELQKINDPQLLEALKNDLILKYGSTIPQEILDQDESDKDKILAIWEYIRIKGLDKKIKVASIQEVTENYLRNKKPVEISEESFSKLRLKFIKRLLKFKTQSPILELPDSVDKLIVLGLTQNEAYDLMIEVFSSELGITRAVLPKYYEAIKTIEKFVKNEKLDTKLSSEILYILKTRAMPVLVAAIRVNASLQDQIVTAKATAAAVASSDIVYQKVEQLIERCTPYIQNQEQSVQEMFTRHSSDSNSNAIFNSILNYGKNKAVGKARDAAVKRFLATEFGKKIAVQFSSKVATAAAATTTGATATGTALGGPVGFIAGLAAGAVTSKIQDFFTWAKIKIKEYAPAAGILAGATIGAVLALAFQAPVAVFAIGGGAAGFALGNAGEVGESLARGVNTFTTGLVDAVGTEIVWPIVTIIIATPIVIALILFIITNSALVVPFSQSEYFGSLFENDGLTNKSSCPIIMTSSAAGSYNPINQKGHGSNEYWSAVYPNNESGKCSFAIPSKSGCYAPTVGSINVCYEKNLKQCDTYGFAMDISSAPPYNVSLPQIDGKDVLWSSNDDEYDEGVVGWTYSYTDSTGKYSIMLKHVNRGMVKGTNLTSGTKLGSLYNQGGTQTHLHLEVQVDGRYVRPENYFCNK